MTFLLSKDYLESPSALKARSRQELHNDMQQALGYLIPEPATLQKHHFLLMNHRLMDELLPLRGGNPLAFFRDFLEREIPELRDELLSLLRNLPAKPEVILSWTNCPSLAAAAAACGIRVAYMEIGPLRSPMYRATGYFDFQGVNGNTEAAKRYLSLGVEDIPDLIPLDGLRLSMSAVSANEGVIEQKNVVGVVLQVEDDSNLISYGNGYDNTALLARSIYEFGDKEILVRKHPGSRFEPVNSKMAVDDSPNSAIFVQRCKKVLTVNSSVGLEALLYGVSVTVLGDSSYAFITEAQNERERLRRLAFYLFSYLVPFDNIFDADYIRFRLNQPSEASIIARHLAIYSDGYMAQEGAEAIKNFVYNSTVLDRLLPGFSEVPGGQEQRPKLYFRAIGQVFAEDRSLPAAELGSGDVRVARFMLPPGVRPEAVRFDPAQCEGIYSLTRVSWGVAEADVDLMRDWTGMGLSDLGLRVTAWGESRLSEPGVVPVKIFADGNDPFIEIATADLFMEVRSERFVGVMEMEFKISVDEHESLAALVQMRDRLARATMVGEDDLRGVRSSIQQLQEAVTQLGTIVEADRLQLLAIQRDIAEVSALIQRDIQGD